MSWHGLGLIAGNWSPLRPIGNLYSPPPRITPAAAWTGEPGSGFAVVPQDPARTTAKPACHLLTPAFNWFTDTLDVGVMAAANNAGSLIPDLGIASVAFHYEGSTITVTQPRVQSIHTERGPRSYFGWWARLKKPAGRSGLAHLYVEATALDPTMQKRVIGPFVFAPVNQRYTHSVTVAPSRPAVTGQNFHTLNDAAIWLNQQASANPLITIAEAGLYELTVRDGVGLGLRTILGGRLNITASVPGVRIGRTSYTTDGEAIINDARYRLRLFGPNLSLDYERVLTINGDNQPIGNGAWLDGCNMINSAPNGAHEPWRGQTKPNGLGAVRGGAFMTEVHAADLTATCTNSSLVRGCTFERLSNDMISNARCVVQSSFRHSYRPLGSSIPAFTVQYTGAEATATLSRSGGPMSFNGGLWTVRIGSAEYTFNTGPGNTGSEPFFQRIQGDGYWMSDVVAWLNTLPGVSATLLLDENISFQRRAGNSGALLDVSGSNGWANRDIKAAPLTVHSHIDAHCDWYQHSAGLLENVIVAFNRVEMSEAQLIFLSPSGNATTAIERDVLFLGNAMAVNSTVDAFWNPAIGGSQFGRGSGVVMSHVVLAHNTLANQNFIIRAEGASNGSTTDAYCMIKHLVARQLSSTSDLAMPNLTVDVVRIHGGSSKPSWATNILAGGDETSLFANVGTGDFTPAGALAQTGFAPVLPFDMFGAPYPPFTAAGAIALAAPQFVPEPPSANALAELLALLNAAGGQNAVHRLRTATNTAAWTSLDMTLNGRNLTQTGAASLRPAIGPGGATFTADNWLSMPIAGSRFSVILSFTKADPSTTGNMLSNAAAGKSVSYRSGTNTVPGPANVRVGDAGVGTQNACYLALHQTGRQLVQILNLDYQTDTVLRLGRGANTSLVGVVDWFIVIDENSFPTNLSQVRSLALQVAAAT